MNLERIWRNEARKRKANELRKDRVNLNWPIHAQQAVDVFRAFATEAKKDNVRLIVIEPRGDIDSLGCKRMGKFAVGASSVHLRFAPTFTGEGMMTRTADAEDATFDFERGAELTIYHSPSNGLVQVFFEFPASSLEGKKSEPLLYDYTYNTDRLTNAWLTSLLPPFLSFNRVESRLEHPSRLDIWRMRWYRFMDVRNRRGYLDKFHHILTPWELLWLGVIIALPGFTLAKWLWGVLYSP